MRRLASGHLRSSAVVSWAAWGAVFALSAAALMLLALGRSTPARAPGQDNAPPPLDPLVAYSVPFESERAEFDLEFAPNTRYLLIVGNLGTADSRFPVHCSSNKVSAARLVPGERVPKLNQVPPQATTEHQVALGKIGAEPPTVNTAAVTPITQTPIPPPLNPQCRTFSLHVTDGTLDDPAQYVTIHANAIAEGRDVRVYLDDQQPANGLAPGLVQNVIDLFDGDVVPRFRKLLGTYRDVDQDGRFAILLSPWLGRLQGGRTSVGGFVRGSDFQACLGRPFSNRCDMMYINSQTVPGAHLRTLLIHEYTHAICFSRRNNDATSLLKYPDEEDWLNEAIAHCAESLFDAGWSNLDYRVARFLDEPSAYSLVVADYYRAGLWRCHGCRGATYLFLRFCVEQFGPQILTSLIGNPSHGTQNLEMATGRSFDDIFRGWTLWLAESAWHRPPASMNPGAESIAGGQLAPLDLYGSLGTWGLAGPRTQLWNIDTEQQQIELRGTSAAYLELVSEGSPGTRRIRLKGTGSTRLFASVVRLEDEFRPIKVDAEMASSPVCKQPGVSGTKCAHVVVRFPGDCDLRVEQISAEQNSGETHASVSFVDAALRQIECPTPEWSANAARINHRDYSLPLTRLSDRIVPIVVSAVAVDRKGHRTSARAILQPSPLPQSERLAQHSQ
jgi:hypothetical protein